jgi:hypothetical protein
MKQRTYQVLINIVDEYPTRNVFDSMVMKNLKEIDHIMCENILVARNIITSAIELTYKECKQIHKHRSCIQVEDVNRKMIRYVSVGGFANIEFLPVYMPI